MTADYTISVRLPLDFEDGFLIESYYLPDSKKGKIIKKFNFTKIAISRVRLASCIKAYAVEVFISESTCTGIPGPIGTVCIDRQRRSALPSINTRSGSVAAVGFIRIAEPQFES